MSSINYFQVTCENFIFSRICMWILTIDSNLLHKDESNEYGIMKISTLSIFSSDRMSNLVTYSNS